MPAPKNILKHRLAAGESLYGCWVGLADDYSAEITASAGFDWLLIDGEHAPNDLRSMVPQLRTVEASASLPVVRLPDDDPVKIKQVLDIGAQSLLIPMVSSAEQARAALAATRYPPQGIRGVGAALARASGFSAIPDYTETANDEICLLVQVESRAGLAALDEILGIDGIDGVFIGPADLAADMGFSGNPAAPEVHDAVVDALTRIRAAGRTAGMLSTSPEFIDDCIGAGANFIGVGIDVTVYASAIRALAARYQS